MLGGGLVPGAVVLLAGEPGIGKSTLLLEAAAAYAAHGRPTLVSPARSRRPRCGCAPTGSARCTTTSSWPPRPTWARCSATSRRSSRGLLVVDSVQTIASAAVDGAPGGVTQVREVAAALIRDAKERGMAARAGRPRHQGRQRSPARASLEHLVDVVLQFEGDRHSSAADGPRGEEPVRRPSDEIGCFEMHDAGIAGLADPSGLFLSRRAESRSPAPASP